MNVDRSLLTKKKKINKKKKKMEEEEVIASLQYCMGSQSKEKTQ
jgi:hypothetical protein